MRKQLGFLAALSIVALPLFSSAQSLPPICAVLGTYSQGSTGNDVTTIQSFLSNQGFFTQPPTGFFGPVTESSLVAFQNQTGIAAAAGGSGIFGTFTKAYIAQHFCQQSGATGTNTGNQCPFIAQPGQSCSGSWQSLVNSQGCGIGWQCVGGTTYANSGSVTFSASPQTGAVPLSTTFTGTLSAQYPQGVLINYGDGSSAIFCQADTVCSSKSVSHTYATAGTYTAALLGVGTSGNTTLATATILAGGSSASTFGVSPSSGSAPLSVTFSWNGPVGSGGWIDFGDGTNVSLSSCGGSSGSSCVGTVAHTYSSGGTFTAILYGSSNQVLNRTSVTVSGGSNPTSGTTSNLPTCVALMQDLTPGETDAQTNGDVSRLQTFLSLYPSVYPQGWVTGYYGSLTQTAVQAFISAHGPIRCDPKGFTANPSSGLQPLTVTLSAQNIDESYFLDFGDGVQADFASTSCATSGNLGNCTYSATHLYGRAGTYIAALDRATSSSSGMTVGIAAITVATSSSACIAPTHDLQIGQSDSDVGGDITLLQQFFVLQGPSIYPEGLISGFFGSATQSAVERFQQKYGISPTGFVGSVTRSAISTICAGGTPASSTAFSFSPSPSSGTAPLSVTFSVANADQLTGGASYVVDFGDSVRGAMISSTAAGSYSLLHTYTAGGTFTATLYKETNLCGGISSVGCVSDLQIAKTTVTVSGSSGGTSGNSGSSCTTAQFTQINSQNGQSSTLEFMNYPGNQYGGQFTSASQSLLSNHGAPTTVTYPELTVLAGDPDWFDGQPNTGTPPSVACAYGNSGDACINYQCRAGVWVPLSAAQGRSSGNGGSNLIEPTGDF